MTETNDYEYILNEYTQNMNPGVKNESVNFKAMVMSFALGFKIQGTSSEKSVSHSSILLANKMACRSFL